MAEKNTESTAINQLIEIVQTQKPLPTDPSEDLMFRKPDRKKVSAPRMSSTVSGIGAIEPLPPARSPSGTQQSLPTVKGVPPNVRVRTAPPRVAATVPPLTLDEEDSEVTNPGPESMNRPTAPGFISQDPIQTRTTKPSIPPPPRSSRPSLPPPMRASTQSRPSLQTTRDFSYPIVQPSDLPPTHQPITVEHQAAAMPIATPFDDPAASWIEHDIGTAQIAKSKNDWRVIAGKLVGPMVVLVIAGIFIGGYFAFDGDGGKKKNTAAAATTEGETVKMNTTVATPDGKFEAPKAEPVKAEPAKTDVKTDVKAEPAKTEVNAAKAEPAKTEAKTAAKTEPAKTEASVTPPNLATATTPSPGKVELVDVRIDSNPAGATVMLIDRGKQTYLGTTPVSAAVDASRKYELVFSYENRATVVESLDPKTTKRVSVKLSRSKSGSPSGTPAVVKSEAPKVEAPKAPAKVEAPKATTKVEAPKAEAKKIESPKAPAKSESGIDGAIDTALKTPAKAEPAKVKAEPAKAESPKPDAVGEGTLMISSKPPCEITIDGKATGLSTPQRDIKLPAGTHKVTLVNTTEGIKKTVSVQISADKPTKVIQDFMK